MTISLSDAANTCVAFFDEKVRSVKGCVPKDTFFLSFNSPVLKFNRKFKRSSPRAHNKYDI
jgi:hypothetical protein